MVYKIISNWKNKDGSQHELKIYRYNYTWDCMTTYSVYDGILEIKFNAPGKIIAHSTQEVN